MTVSATVPGGRFRARVDFAAARHAAPGPAPAGGADPARDPTPTGHRQHLRTRHTAFPRRSATSRRAVAPSRLSERAVLVPHSASGSPATPERRSFLRTVRVTLTTPSALIYLGGFVALLVWAIASTVAHAPDDASLAMIWPMLATLPLSVASPPMLSDHPAVLFAPMLLGALVNAYVVGWCHRVLTSER